MTMKGAVVTTTSDFSYLVMIFELVFILFCGWAAESIYSISQLSSGHFSDGSTQVSVGLSEMLVGVLFFLKLVSLIYFPNVF